jgi:hypothetical protein
MGHVDAGQTETYAPGGEFASVTSALNRLLESIDTLRPGALHRSATGPALKTGTKEAEKMT